MNLWMSTFAKWWSFLKRGSGLQNLSKLRRAIYKGKRGPWGLQNHLPTRSCQVLAMTSSSPCRSRWHHRQCNNHWLHPSEPGASWKKANLLPLAHQTKILGFMAQIPGLHGRNRLRHQLLQLLPPLRDLPKFKAQFVMRFRSKFNMHHQDLLHQMMSSAWKSTLRSFKHKEPSFKNRAAHEQHRDTTWTAATGCGTSGASSLSSNGWNPAGGQQDSDLAEHTARFSCRYVQWPFQYIGAQVDLTVWQIWGHAGQEVVLWMTRAATLSACHNWQAWNQQVALCVPMALHALGVGWWASTLPWWLHVTLLFCFIRCFILRWCSFSFFCFSLWRSWQSWSTGQLRWWGGDACSCLLLREDRMFQCLRPTWQRKYGPATW